MLKDQLLQEAKTINVDVQLDNIFESVQLSEDVKQNFATVFQASVKKHAIQLAESHIQQIAEKAEKKVEEEVEKETEKLEENMLAIADKFFAHTAQQWLAENQVAVDRGIKADLFESMFGGLKTLFVEHNVVLPAESVDVVAELEEELQETKTSNIEMFNSLNEAKTSLSNLKREVAIGKATDGLTESQKEKVQNLIEGLEYSDQFDIKLGAIVEMAKASKATSAQNLTEATVINKSNADAAGLNFITEAAVEPTTPSSKNAYVIAAQRI